MDTTIRNVTVVAGTRPNFVKVAPLLRTLSSEGIHASLIHTGQHFDSAMSDVFFAELSIQKPDVQFSCGNRPNASQIACVIDHVASYLRTSQSDVLLVVGDVNSTVGAAMAAVSERVPVAHVEAGLRSFDWSMPEESNRIITDRISHILYAPSEDAVQNLLDEGTHPSRIEFVGNVMIDTLFHAIGLLAERPSKISVPASPYGLVTLHRSSLVDDPGRLGEFLTSIHRLTKLLPLVWPVHPRVQRSLPKDLPNVTFLPPLGYLEFLDLERQARLVITDSGGVQEETTALGVPCFTYRENTERPITVTHGTNTVVGLDPELLIQALESELDEPAAPRKPPFWDGLASRRIVSHLLGSDLSAAISPAARR